MLVMRVPDSVKSESDIRVRFREESLDLEIIRPPLGTVSLTCPPIVPTQCQSELGSLTT